MKTAIKIGSAVALLLGLRYLLRTKAAGDDLTLSIAGASIKFGGGIAARLEVNVQADNPHAQSLKVDQPYLKVFYEGKEVGNSTPSTERYEIPGNGTARFPINVNIPYTGAGAALFNVLQAVLTDSVPPVRMTIRVQTVVNGIPISQDLIADIPVKL